MMFSLPRKKRSPYLSLFDNHIFWFALLNDFQAHITFDHVEKLGKGSRKLTQIRYQDTLFPCPLTRSPVRF